MGKEKSILDILKEDLQRGGSSGGRLIFLKENEKIHFRFLKEFDKTLRFFMHNDYESNFQCVCHKLTAETMFDDQDPPDCEYCDAGIRTTIEYAFCVWDYDTKSVRILHCKPTSSGFLGSLSAYYNQYHTIMDRDYIIEKIGKGQGSTTSLISLDKSTFDRPPACRTLKNSAMLKEFDSFYTRMGQKRSQRGDQLPSSSSGSQTAKQPYDRYDDDYEEEDRPSTRRSEGRNKQGVHGYRADDDRPTRRDSASDRHRQTDYDDYEEEEDTPRPTRSERTSRKPKEKPDAITLLQNGFVDLDTAYSILTNYVDIEEDLDDDQFFDNIMYALEDLKEDRPKAYTKVSEAMVKYLREAF